MNLPAYLRAVRTRLGYTQEQMAGALGVAANTIARWERGAMPVEHPRILRLALERLEKGG